MPTEQVLEGRLFLDEVRSDPDLFERLSLFEAQKCNVVFLTAGVDDFSRVASVLSTLRAANVGCLLFLKRSQNILDEQELLLLIERLGIWDQLSLHNILELCEGWFPAEFAANFAAEAKLELKWLREWLLGSFDSRIHKYPGLPWRSYLRKVMAENHSFVKKFLEVSSMPSSQESQQILAEHLKAFLESKKKVLCTYPKRWRDS